MAEKYAIIMRNPVDQKVATVGFWRSRIMATAKMKEWEVWIPENEAEMSVVVVVGIREMSRLIKQAHP